MPCLGDRIRWIGLIGSRARVAALDATLGVADPAETDAIAAELLRIAARQGAAPGAAADSLVRHWPRLSAAARDAAGAALANRLPAALRRMLGGADAGARRAALVAAAELGDATLLRELTGVFLDPARSEEHAMAAETLEILATATGRDPGVGGAALRDAMETFERHRCGGVVAACLAFVGAGGAVGGPARAELLGRLLDDREHPASMALRARLRGRGQGGAQDDGGAARAAALTLLKWDGMKGAAAERLAAPAGGGGHARMLERWHLLGHPARRRRAARLAQRAAKGTPWLPGCEETAELEARARRGLVELAEATLGPRGADAVAARLLLDPEAAVRHAAVRALARRPIGGGALHDLCFDSDERVARSAALAALARDVDSGRAGRVTEEFRAALARSPHACVRGLVRSFGAPLSGRWPAMDRAPEAVLSAAAAQGAEITPTAARHAAAAATVLGRLRGWDAESALRHALHIRDARVRANAMESLVHVARRRWAQGEIAGPIVELLLHGAADAEHRIRANSIRGVILAAQGGAVAAREGSHLLRVMLDDARPMHRIAGLWLVERMAPALAGATEVIDRVSAMSHDAAQAAEHARAASAAQRLMGAVRAGWARRVAPLEVAA